VIHGAKGFGCNITLVHDDQLSWDLICLQHGSDGLKQKARTITGANDDGHAMWGEPLTIEHGIDRHDYPKG
jgi:hypothetical protein